MANSIRSIRGFNDILPDRTPLWHTLEATTRAVLQRYGYREIRLPCVESTELFKRSIGEVTDIVEKEMYTFADRNGDSLTLRPEGTAGCVRAAAQHGLVQDGDHLTLSIPYSEGFNNLIGEGEKLILLNALRRNRGNKSRVTQQLRIPRQTLYNKLEKYGIVESDYLEETEQV